MTNLDSILKSRDITLPTKVHSVKAMVFPVVMYGCESWTIKKAECQRIDAFDLWCWRRLLRVPWTSRGSNQSILKEISPGYPLEVLLLKWNSNTVATWCEELTHLKRPWCREGLPEGREVDDRGWGDWMASLTQWTWVWVNSRSWWWTGRPGLLQLMGSQNVRQDWVTELTDWTNWTNWLTNCSLRKAFLSFLVILWNSAFRWVYLSFSPLFFTSLLFTAIWKASSESHFAFLHCFFLGMVLILSLVQCQEPLSIILQGLCLSTLVP